MNATELFRKNHTAILKAIAETGQARIADQMGVSESTISRYKDADLERLSGVLAAAGLMVVPKNTQYLKEGEEAVDSDRLRAITILARETLKETGWGAPR